MSEHDFSIEFSRQMSIIVGDFTRPSTLYAHALKISRDGNQYCILFGSNLQDGVAGFGRSIDEAMRNFDSNYYQEIN